VINHVFAFGEVEVETVAGRIILNSGHIIPQHTVDTFGGDSPK